MSKSFLKAFSPLSTQRSDYYNIICNNKTKVLGPPIYLMDWSFIFEQIDIWKKNNPGISTILDIGCGNSMFHTFLESHYKHGIIGIDRSDTTDPNSKFAKFAKEGHTMVNAIDICCDFIEEGVKFFNNNVDIVFWNSAIEHNSIENMKKAVDVSLNSLKKKGIFISTWALGEKTHWNKSISATILSSDDAKEIFQTNWIEEPNFKSISNEFKENNLSLKDWHLKRFGHLNIDYVHAGNITVKE